jgi:hypothetical protein
VVDIDDMLKRVLLFDQVIVESAGFAELPELLRVLKYDDTLRLVEATQWDFSTTQLGSIGEKGFGPLGTALKYSLGKISWTHYETERDKRIDQVLRSGNLSRKQRSKLEQQIRSRLLSPIDIAMEVRGQLDSDLDSSPNAINRIVAQYAATALGQPFRAADFSLTIHVEEPGVYVADTDLSKRTGLSLQQVHKSVERGILALAQVNHRFGIAQKRWAITGFDPEHEALVEAKLDALARRGLSDEEIRRFDRVLLLADLPDLGFAARTGNLNVEQLLKVRQTRECEDFRVWLSSTDTATDDEIAEAIGGLRQQLALFTESIPGNALRWLVVKGASVKLGPVPGLIDKYVLDRLLPRPGPAAFLSRSFRGVYQLNAEEFLGGDVKWTGPTG